GGGLLSSVGTFTAAVHPITGAFSLDDVELPDGTASIRATALVGFDSGDWQVATFPIGAGDNPITFTVDPPTLAALYLDGSIAWFDEPVPGPHTFRLHVYLGD